MREVDVTMIPELISKAHGIPRLNLLFIGDTGIGKTEMVQRYCKENEIYLVDLKLGQLDPSDCLNVPVQGKRMFRGIEYNVLRNATPEWVFELAEHEKAMLFLDELLCGEPAVCNAFLTFLVDKKVNGIDLSHVQIVAATNIGEYTFDLDKNMLSRFCMFYVVNNDYRTFLMKKYRDKYIDFNYKDEEERDNVIFEKRSLKPRCGEILCNLNKLDIPMFYEGFTNEVYKEKVIFSDDEIINGIISSYANITQDENGYFVEATIDDGQLRSLAASFIAAYPKTRKWDDVINNIRRIYLDKEALKSMMNDVSAARSKV